MALAAVWQSDKRKIGTWVLLMALALAVGLAAGCDDGSTEPESQGPDATELFPGLTVSDVEGAAGGGILAAGSEGLTYVSASPGTFLDVQSITITNLANGKTRTVEPIDGGFDPVPLEAEPGDELEILVHHSDGSTTRYVATVPARKRPRVVRTVPPKDATDIVLSASVVVVFSEPVDSSTVTAENLQLQIDGEPVEGTLALSDDGLRAEFIPTEPLKAGTTYTLVITSGVLDLQGDALEEEVRTTFTTENLMQFATTNQTHTCALNIDGVAYCWGLNTSGELGRPGSSVEPPGRVITTLRFTYLTAGSYHTCGLTENGEAYCWGWNDTGQLGNGTQTTVSGPVAVSGGHRFVSLVAGLSFTCGLADDGAAYCWGLNGLGQLGTTTSETCTDWLGNSLPCSTTPVPVSGGHRFAALATGGRRDHNCGLTAGGTALCWGMGGFGQLGTTEGLEYCGPEGYSGEGSWDCSATPLPVAGGLRFTSLTVGETHTCGVATGGAAYCWGFNFWGQLGNGERTLVGNFPEPVAVVGGHSFVTLAADGVHTCGLTRNGSAYCWGRNNVGNLGIGELSEYVLEPIAVTGSVRFESLTACWNHTCGISSDGHVYCWGFNRGGVVGAGSLEDRVSSPTRIRIP
jgi:alpha-tubulin suppressor-like RCC1 family protein